MYFFSTLISLFLFQIQGGEEREGPSDMVRGGWKLLETVSIIAGLTPFVSVVGHTETDLFRNLITSMSLTTSPTSGPSLITEQYPLPGRHSFCLILLDPNSIIVKTTIFSNAKSLCKLPLQLRVYLEQCNNWFLTKRSVEDNGLLSRHKARLPNWLLRLAENERKWRDGSYKGHKDVPG